MKAAVQKTNTLRLVPAPRECPREDRDRDTAREPRRCVTCGRVIFRKMGGRELSDSWEDDRGRCPKCHEAKEKPQ
jgi:hypothetical protein